MLQHQLAEQWSASPETQRDQETRLFNINIEPDTCTGWSSRVGKHYGAQGLDHLHLKVCVCLCSCTVGSCSFVRGSNSNRDGERSRRRRRISSVILTLECLVISFPIHDNHLQLFSRFPIHLFSLPMLRREIGLLLLFVVDGFNAEAESFECRCSFGYITPGSTTRSQREVEVEVHLI